MQIYGNVDDGRFSMVFFCLIACIEATLRMNNSESENQIFMR